MTHIQGRLKKLQNINIKSIRLIISSEKKKIMYFKNPAETLIHRKIASNFRMVSETVTNTMSTLLIGNYNT